MFHVKQSPDFFFKEKIAFLNNGGQNWEVIDCPTPINMEKK